VARRLIDGIRTDVEALAAMDRGTAGPGERAAAAWVAQRLRDADLAEVGIEPFRAPRTYAWWAGAHCAAGLVAAARRNVPLALGALASLELHGSGRRPWLDPLLPRGEGANVVARIPARGERRATVVLVAHHDAARTGIVWHPRVTTLNAGRHLKRRRVDPFMGPLAAGFLLAATPWRAAGAALLATGLATLVDTARSPTVPGASDNATGVAVLLWLARELAATAPPHLETIAVSTGAEESGIGGMRAFLRAHGGELDPARTLVLSLDTLGAGTPIVASAEGVLRQHRYREEDLLLADRGAARAGLPAPQRWRLGGWTDPILARFAGLPAISLLSMGPGYFPHYHHPSDLPEHVDWDSVERCAMLAHGIAEAHAG